MHGRARLQQQQLRQEKLKALGGHMRDERLQKMHESMRVFKDSLEEFALKYKGEIRADPEFRAQFHQMCANIGVDPLTSNKSTWNKLLGFGDFYYNLGVQVVEACIATRPSNGGLCELSTLLRYVQRRRGSKAVRISKDDVLQAIKKLQVLDKTFQVIKVNAQTFVSSVPREISMDMHPVLELAAKHGCVSFRMLRESAQWTEARASLALDRLVKDGTCLVDDGDPSGERLFWFPCVELPSEH